MSGENSNKHFYTGAQDRLKKPKDLVKTANNIYGIGVYWSSTLQCLSPAGFHVMLAHSIESNCTFRPSQLKETKKNKAVRPGPMDMNVSLYINK